MSAPPTRSSPPSPEPAPTTWGRWLEPGFWQDAADVIAAEDTAGFIAALAAELFPRTREAQLQWWDEAEMVDVDVPVPSPSVTPLHAVVTSSPAAAMLPS